MVKEKKKEAFFVFVFFFCFACVWKTMDKHLDLSFTTCISSNPIKLVFLLSFNTDNRPAQRPFVDQTYSPFASTSLVRVACRA